MDQPKTRLTPGEGPGQKSSKDKEEDVYIPTRERLLMQPLEVSEEDIREAKVQSRLAWGMLAALVVLVTAVVVSVALAPPKPAEEDQVAQAEDQTSEPAGSDSTAHGDSASSAAATKPEPPKPAPKPPPTQAAAPTTVQLVETPPPTPFGIVVGSYLNEARAQEEAAKLKGSTSLDARIEPFDDGGVPSFRVVLGNFPSRAAAQRKANDLIGQDLVYEARVAPLK